MAMFNSYVKLPEGTSWGMIDKHTAESTNKHWGLSGDSMEMNHGKITHSMIKKGV